MVDRSTEYAHTVIIIIKVFLKHKILSLETILSAHTHAQAPAHTSILTTQSV